MANGCADQNLCHWPVAPSLMAFPPSSCQPLPPPPDFWQELLEVCGLCPAPTSSHCLAEVRRRRADSSPERQGAARDLPAAGKPVRWCASPAEISGCSTAITAWRFYRGRIPQPSTFGYVVLASCRQRSLEISASASKNGAGSTFHGTPVVGGRFRPRNLAHGLADLQDEPLPQPVSGPSKTRKTDRRGALIPFMNFAGVPAASRSCRPRPPYNLEAGPARRQGPWFAPQPRPPGGLAKTNLRAKSCLTKAKTWPVAGGPLGDSGAGLGGSRSWSGLLVFAAFAPGSQPGPARPSPDHIASRIVAHIQDSGWAERNSVDAPART